MADQAGTLLVQDKGGFVRPVPADRYQDAIASGEYFPVSNAELQKMEQIREAGTAGGMTRTAATGIVAGVTDFATGIPQLALAGLQAAGVEGAGTIRENISGRKVAENLAAIGGELRGESGEAVARQQAIQQRIDAEVNPITAFSGYVGGQVLGSAGIGMLARGAGAVGEGVAARAGNAVSQRLGGGVGGRIAGAAVEQGIEGLPMGAAMAQDAAYLENRRLTGEQVIADALTMGGVSAILGGATKGLGELLGAARGRAAAVTAPAAQELEGGAAAIRATETTTREAEQLTARGSGEVALTEQAADKAAAERTITAADREKLQKVIYQTTGEEAAPGADKALQRMANGEAPEKLVNQALEKHTVDVSENLTRAKANIDTLTRGVDEVPLKYEKVAAKLEQSGVDQAAALNSVRSVSAGVRSELEQTIGQLGESVKKGDRAVKLYQKVEQLDDRIAKTSDAADAYMAADEMRRAMLDARKRYADDVRRAIGTDKDIADALGKTIGDGYDRLWPHLMDDTVWGAQGATQKGINETRVRLIQAERFALRQFADEVGSEYLGNGLTRGVYQANEARVLSTMRQLGDIGGKPARDAMQRYAQAASDFAEAMKGYSLGAAESKAAEEAAKSATALQQSFANAVDGMRAVDQAQKVLRASETRNALLGSGIAAQAFGVATSPAKQLVLKMQVEGAAQKVKETATRSFDGLFTGMRARSTGGNAATPASASIPQAKGAKVSTGRIGAAASRYAAPTAMQLFQGNAKTADDAYDRKRDQLRRATDNMGQGIRASVTRQLGESAESDPHLLASAVQTATRAALFLQSKMDTPPINPNSLTPTASKPRPSKAELYKVSEYWAAVERPVETVTRDLRAGTLVPEHVEAIKAVYPSLFAWMQTETIRRLGEMDRAGVEVPLRQRAAIDSLLELNGAGEPAFAPAFGAKYGPRMGDGANQERPQPPPRPIQGTGSARLATQTDKMMGGMA